MKKFFSFSILSSLLSKKIYFLIFLLFFISAFFSLSRIIFHEGWPYNDEYLRWALRTVIYAEHFKQGDFFPIWMSDGLFGMGYPLPLFYHKLFYYLSGFLFLITSSVKTSMVLSTLLFLIVGQTGVYLCSRTVGLDRILSVIVAMFLPLLNYTIYDWLTRGAFSEFSAFMLLPFLFNWCLNLIKNSKFSFSIIPILFLLFYAHSVIAYFSIVIIGISALIFMLDSNNKQKRTFLYRSLISSAAFLLLTLPYLVILSGFKTNFDLDILITGPCKPLNHFVHIEKYFLTSIYGWGKDYNNINFGFNGIILLVYSIMLTGIVVIKSKAQNFIDISSDNFKVLIFLFISFSFFMFLQFPNSNFIFETIPGFIYIQHPTRLMTFMNIILLVGISLSFVFFQNRKFKVLSIILSIILLTGLIFEAPLKSPEKSKGFLDNELSEGKLFDRFRELFVIGEYSPIIKNNEMIFSMFSPYLLATVAEEDIKYVFYHNLSQRGIEFKGYGKCKINPFKHAKREQLNFSTNVECNGPVLAILPFNYSGFEKIEIVRNDSKEKISSYREDYDARIRIALPEGKYKLKVSLPKFPFF